MERIRPIFFLSSCVLLLSSLIFFFQSRAQTYCYTTVKTLSPNSPPGNCFTVSRSGTFSKVFLLDLESAKKYKRDGHVLPGLWDGHGHLLQYGEMLHSVDLFGSDSLDVARKRIHQYAIKNPEEGTRNQWIRGIGWDQAAFGGSMPTAADLSADPLLQDKYIMLDRVDVHCIWVSQAVLDLLPDPLPPLPGGEVVTSPGMGVFCDNAMDFVREYWPPPPSARKKQFYRTAAKELNKLGLVGIHDAALFPDDLKALEDVVEDPDWSLRVYGMFQCAERNTFCPEQARKIDRPDGLLIVRSVKLFADGALGSWGSALLSPYTDRPTTSGSLLVNASQLTSLATSWSSLGYQVNIHAIGDLANRLAIDALEASLRQQCPSSSPTTESLSTCQRLHHRHRIEHAQIIHPTDQSRLLALNLLPSLQPTHPTSDMSYAESRLGPIRTAREAYRMNSLLHPPHPPPHSPPPQHLVLGSDFPVEPPSPFHGIYAAVTRKSPRTGKGKDGAEEGWYSEEALGVMDALRGFTVGPAWGAFMEGRAGGVERGMWADWVVVDEDVFGEGRGDVEGLRGLRVRETWVRGRRVYRRED